MPPLLITMRTPPWGEPETCSDSMALMMPHLTQLPVLGERLYLFLIENARPSLVWGLVSGGQRVSRPLVSPTCPWC